MIFGADYYPEHWDKSEWEEQARLMNECGINTVRIGEFAWKIIEKDEGSFDFSLMDSAIELLASHGIRVIMGTPTAAPPKWLVNKYDVLQRDRYSRPRGFGSRRECCANSADYIEKSRIITEELARHYGGNPNIIAWQIDNEFGCHNSTRCYCESCRRKFGRWLSERYSSIDELNKKWGNVFWSLDYDFFDDVILPAYTSCEADSYPNFSHNPSLDMEYRRFASDSWVEYQQMQIDIIKKYTSVPITHNLMGHFSDIDYRKLAEGLDVVSWDNYPENQWGSSEYQYVSMAHEIMRGVKNQNFWVMEEQAGPAGWDVMGRTPRPGELRLWTYQAIAHGAEGIVYFRFKTAPFGMEQYWYGILDHDGIPRRRFYELQKTGRELQSVSDYICGSETEYDALIIKSYENVWSHEIKRHTAGFDYNSLLYAYYKANCELNIAAAVGDDDFSKYKVVYMPAYNLITDDVIEKAEAYVKNGGTLVLTFRSGGRDEYNNIKRNWAFSDLAGIELEEFDAVKREVSVCGAAEGSAHIWCDIITPVTARVLCEYSSEYYKGRAAVTVNSVGAGRVYYVGCDMDANAMRELVRIISQKSGITPVTLPQNTELVKKISRSGEGYMMLLNHNETPVRINIKGKSLISGNAFDGELAPYGAEMIKA